MYSYKRCTYVDSRHVHANKQVTYIHTYIHTYTDRHLHIHTDIYINVHTKTNKQTYIVRHTYKELAAIHMYI